MKFPCIAPFRVPSELQLAYMNSLPSVSSNGYCNITRFRDTYIYRRKNSIPELFIITYFKMLKFPLFPQTHERKRKGMDWAYDCLNSTCKWEKGNGLTIKLLSGWLIDCIWEKSKKLGAYRGIKQYSRVFRVFPIYVYILFENNVFIYNLNEK